jgi:hypothetical protein
MIWPTPFAMTTTLRVDGAKPSKIILPVIAPSDRAQPDFMLPAQDPELPGYRYLKVGDESISGYAETRRIERSPLTYQTRIVASGTEGSVYPWATIKSWEELAHTAQDIDPAKASVSGKIRYIIELEKRTVTIESELLITSDRDNFYYTYTRRALENGKLIKEKTWDETIPRDHH